MLINLAGRRLYYTLEGPENGQVVCFTHSLASDGGMWAEQVPPLLAAGYRVLRLDMRGHGGSDPVAGPYTMAQLADDVAAALDFLGIQKVQYIGLSIGGMIGQAFAIAHGQRLISAMWCDTSPQTPARRRGRLGAAHRGREESQLAARRSPTRPWSAGSPTPTSRAIPAAGSRSTPPSPAPRPRATSAAPPPSSTSTSRPSCRR